MQLALKIVVPLLAYAVVWLQAYLDYKKGWRDKRTRLHRLGFQMLTWLVVPGAVLLTLVLVVAEDRATKTAERQLAGIRATLDQVAAVVGAKSQDDVALVVRELKAQVTEQEKQLASAGSEIVKQKGQISGLEQRAAPRTLSTVQASGLVAALRGRDKGAVNVQSVIGDDEAFAYARQIKAALAEAGWPVTGVDRVMRTTPSVGTAIMSGLNPPSRVFVDLVAAFRSAGVEVRPTYSPPLGEGSVVVLIGAKETGSR